MSVHVTTNIRYASSVLARGEVSVRGFDVEFVPPEPNTTVVFNDFIHHLTCDAIDLPLSNYIIARDLGNPVTAIPAFPTMYFPILGPMINRKAGIRRADDLIGKRVGTSGFAFNPAVLVRHLLFHDLDIPIERITWVEGEPNSMSGVPFPRSRRFTIEKGENLMQLLDEGKLDAVIMSDGGVEPTPLIDRLFPDYLTHLDQLVTSIGTVPINSVIVLKDEVLAANPGLDRALTDAYHEAWLAYLAAAPADGRHMGLAIADLRARGLFPPARGFHANRKAIRLLIHACYEQGLVRTLFEPEEIFAIID